MNKGIYRKLPGKEVTENLPASTEIFACMGGNCPTLVVNMVKFKFMQIFQKLYVLENFPTYRQKFSMHRQKI
jgi:hypothetical protein